MQIPTHRSTGLSPRTRGLELGQAFRTQVHGTVRCYLALFKQAHGLTRRDAAALGSGLRESLQEEWADLVDEVDGIALGADTEPDLLLAINARTEILAGSNSAECTALAHRSSTNVLLAQNWDWHVDQAPNLLLWTVTNGAGWFTTLTEAGIIGKIGVNSSRLGLLLNLLPSARVLTLTRPPIHFLLRRILDSARTFDEAVAFARTAVDASSAVTLGSVADVARAVTVEMSPTGARTVLPDSGGWLVHTNHVLLDTSEPESAADPGSMLREADARSVLSRSATNPTLATMYQVLSSHNNAPQSICAHVPAGVDYRQRQQTLACVTIDVERRRLAVTPGLPCKSRCGSESAR
jgi:isopenicillin-N N-acyltransferase-like protein